MRHRIQIPFLGLRRRRWFRGRFVYDSGIEVIDDVDVEVDEDELTLDNKWHPSVVVCV